jgi:hypothetical protein
MNRNCGQLDSILQNSSPFLLCLFFVCEIFHTLVESLKCFHTNFSMIVTFMLGMGMYEVSNRVDISWVCSC